MQRYATTVLFAAFAAGVLVCRTMPVAVWASAALSVAGAGVYLSRKGKTGLASGTPTVMAWIAAVFFIGAWRGELYFSPLDDALENLPWYRELDYRATVSQVPPYGGQKVRYVSLTDLHSPQLADMSLERYVFSMAVPLTDTLEVGDVLFGRGMLSPLRAPLNPDDTDFRRINHRKGVVGELRNEGYRIEGREVFSGNAIRDRALKYIRTALEKNGVSPGAARLTMAVLLGDKAAVDPETRQAYRLSGAMHLLVVSGLHVGIVAGVVFLLTGFLAARRKWRVGVVLTILWGYGFLAGYPPSVVRALWMYTILLLSGLGQGKYFSFGALCLAGLVDLAVRPQDVYSAGFQMSYAASAALILSYGGIVRWSGRIRPAILEYPCRLLLVTLTAQAALLPFVLYYFDSLNLLFPLANLLLVPVVCYAVIPAGALLAVLSCLGLSFPPLVWAYNRLADYCTAVASEIAAREAFALSGLGMGFSAVVLAVFLCAALLLVRRSVKVAAIVALLGGIVCCSVCLGTERPYPFIGKRDGRYIVGLDDDRETVLEEGTLVFVGKRSFWVLPRGSDAESPAGRYVLLARRYFEPKVRPECVVLAPEVSGQEALRWKDYALRYGIPLHDMREKGYFVFAQE